MKFFAKVFEEIRMMYNIMPSVLFSGAIWPRTD